VLASFVGSGFRGLFTSLFCIGRWPLLVNISSRCYMFENKKTVTNMALCFTVDKNIISSSYKKTVTRFFFFFFFPSISLSLDKEKKKKTRGEEEKNQGKIKIEM
jgi:hypothetical protein